MISQPKKVLIVDDDPTTVFVLKIVLERRGCQAFIAMDGEEALEKVEHETLDLVILDLGLPKLSGEEVCRKIRKNEKVKNIPIIMVSAKCTDTDRIIGRVIGANYYITKPVDVTTLIKAVNSVLGKHN